MSNEFEVDDIYNYTIKELEQLKEEFISRCDHAINYKKSINDFSNHATFKNWWHKWEGWVDDDQADELAHEHYIIEEKERQL